MTGFLSAIVAAILFGVGGTFAQYLFQNRGINTEWLVTIRLLGAGSVLLALSAMRDWRAVTMVWRDRRDVLQLILFGIVGMMPVQYTYFAAIRASNTATATVLQYTGPAMIAAWLALRGRRWPSRSEYCAVALALAGTFFLVTHGYFGMLSISPLALFWGLASAAAAAFNSLQPERLLRKYGAAHVTGWGMMIGGIALSFVHAPWRVEGVWDARSYLFIAFILIFGTLMAFYLYLKAVHLIGAQKSALLTCAEPLSAAVLAVWWLGVSFGAMDWLGTICILATVALLSRGQSEESQLEKVT
jgi:drug/metabolite transporter (DMT)-like permease